MNRTDTIEQDIAAKLQAERPRAPAMDGRGLLEAVAKGDREYMQATRGAALKLGAVPAQGSEQITASTIAARMDLLIKAMYEVAESARLIAAATAGQNQREEKAEGNSTRPGGTIFERYGQAMDELDAIVDNVRHEQRRTREAID